MILSSLSEQQLEQIVARVIGSTLKLNAETQDIILMKVIERVEEGRHKTQDALLRLQQTQTEILEGMVVVDREKNGHATMMKNIEQIVANENLLLKSVKEVKQHQQENQQAMLKIIQAGEEARIKQLGQIEKAIVINSARRLSMPCSRQYDD